MYHYYYYRCVYDVSRKTGKDLVAFHKVAEKSKERR